MNQIVTTGIVLARTNYGEADRILTLLTPDQGKLRLMAKGVRRVKSKLAGGIELFSVSNITFIRGRGDMGTLVSSRLLKYYAAIVTDINRTMAGYDIIKQLNKAIEDEPEPEYFELLEQALQALDDASVPLELIRVWFSAQLLRLSGHTPNLTHELSGAKLQADKSYEFNFDDSSFIAREDAAYGADNIKFLRILFSGNVPAVITKVAGCAVLVERCRPLVLYMSQQYAH